MSLIPEGRPEGHMEASIRVLTCGHCLVLKESSCTANVDTSPEYCCVILTLCFLEHPMNNVTYICLGLLSASPSFSFSLRV